MIPQVPEAELTERVTAMSSPATIRRGDTHLAKKVLPLLENGDTLDTREFLRRFERMPHVKKAELINGVVFMASPVRLLHANPHSDLSYWLTTYRVATAGVRSPDNVTFKLTKRTAVQPDVMLYTEASLGGKSQASKRGYVIGSPELAAEVAASSVSLDAGPKREIYLEHGVAEYVLWRVEDEAIDWWTLRDGEYAAIEPDPADGLLKSVVYPGLWLDKGAMLRGEMPAVLAALHRGLASPEHAAFAAKLHPDAARGRGTLAGPADL